MNNRLNENCGPLSEACLGGVIAVDRGQSPLDNVMPAVRELELLSAARVQAQACLHSCACPLEAQASKLIDDADRVALIINDLIEEERKHIACEVHDELGQSLTALGLHLSLLLKRVGIHLPEVAKDVQSMRILVDRALCSVRNVTNRLRPPELEKGLISGIEWLCGEFAEDTQMVCLFHVPDDAFALDETRTVAVFRIVQAALTNVSRHARASRVDVRMWRAGNLLSVDVRDNGCGFDPTALARQRRTFGLFGMRERAMVLGGRLEVNSHPGRGTVVVLSLPLSPVPKMDTE